MEPIIFKNHHRGITTIVLGNYCYNGCQMFHKDDAFEKFKDFSVLPEHQEDVMKSFRDGEITYIPTQNPHLNIMYIRLGFGYDDLYNHRNPKIRKEVAKAGKYLDILVNDPCDEVRAEVAKHHKHDDILKNDTSEIVQKIYLDEFVDNA